MKNTAKTLSGLWVVISALALIVIIYLSYFFPRTLQEWSDAGTDLSGAQQSIASMSMFCVQHGLFAILIALAGVMVAVVLGIVAKEQ